MPYLLTSVDSALIRVKAGDGARGYERSEPEDLEELKIELRNLKALLIVSRLTERTLSGCLYVLALCFCLPRRWSGLDDIYSKIEIVLDQLIHAREIEYKGMATKVRLLVIQLNEEMSSYQPLDLLTVNEVIGIAGSVTNNAPGFLSLVTGLKLEKQTDAFEAIDAFEVQMRFMKNVLEFAVRAGVQVPTAVVLQMQPVVIEAARVFIMDDAAGSTYPRLFNMNDIVNATYGNKLTNRRYENWCIKIGSNCLEVNRMATDPQVYQAYSHILVMARLSSTPSQMGDETVQNLLYSLISLLWDSLRHTSGSVIKDGFILLYESLRFLREVVRQRETSLNEAISGQVRVLICDAGVLICSFHQPDTDQLSDLLQRFDGFRQQVVSASPTMQANDEAGFVDFKTIDTPDGNEMAPQAFGFQGDEVDTVLDRLIGGSKHLRIVPVCGMAGLGKTTFALKLFNHPSVLPNFRAHAWFTVSQELDKKKVLLELLNQIRPGNYSDMTEDDLANKLRQSILRRPYLILLDDVWSSDAWNSLKASFPDDCNGSRIILTSRRVDIAPSRLPDEAPHLLRLREESECVEILRAKLSHKDSWSFDLGWKVAKICKGLPLTLVIVSGLLATTEQQGWKAILDHLSSGNSVSNAEQCNIALELGYKHLPGYLQPCFLYFGGFKEDAKVSVGRLIRLWMAEGFVLKNESKRIEDVGQEYMEKLIERSLVMVMKNRSSGGAKIVQIHDLLHGFCRSKMKQENLLHLFPQTHDQLHLQRLSIHTAPTDFKEARLFCPDAISLLFCHGGWLADISFIIQSFQRLKVMYIGGVWLTNGIPNEIGLLARLSYLSFRTALPIIPSSIGSLSNLETLMAHIQTDKDIAFPSTLWNLQKLKCLCIASDGRGRGFTLPVEDTENSPSLLKLETLSGVILYSDRSVRNQLKKFPRIRRLKCTFLQRFHWANVILGIPTQLESLSMSTYAQCEFVSTAKNLRKLKLENLELSREEIGKIGRFPNLEVLKLTNVRFPDRTFGMEEEEFPELRFLRLSCCDRLERWTTSDDELPSLQKLEIWSCEKLEEIPSWLETSSTLQEIQLSECSSTLECLVRGIEEVQRDYNNLIFKLRIVSREED